MCYFVLLSLSGISQADYFLHSTHFSKKDFPLEITDSLTIIPESIILHGYENKKIEFDILQKTNNIYKLSLLDTTCADTLKLSYRTLHNNLSHKHVHIDSSELTTQDQVIYIGYEYSPFKNKNPLIESSGLDYDGSFSRGFSLGNSQSLLLNSDFNLQMAGDLGTDIRIKAAISDDNIPIQAEGNTQVLQEFDKVFIQVDRKQTSIIAGDFEEQLSSSYFLRYLKKLKGLKVHHEENLDSKGVISGSGSFAQSQGKFSRQSVPTIEGNQGPYKLNGNNGELFLIVRSGTEKVYYDGKLLKRGIDEDYTISYDRAELIFTQKILITKDSRIVIEFEYVDRNYQRTSYIASTDYQIGKFAFSANIYNESDSKNLQQDILLDSIDIDILQNAGDNLAQTQRSGVRNFTDEFDPDLILYKQIIENDSIYYQYTTSPDSAKYVISFSNVGSEKGSYSIDNQSTTNGRVYKYVGPGNGSFEPIKKLTAPQQKQIVTLSTSYSPTEHRRIQAELAISNTDLNRFSSLDKEDDQGLALNIGVQDKIAISSKERGWSIAPLISYETVHKNFKTINPYRSPEFNRDWNQSNVDSTNQKILTTSLSIQKNNQFKLGYTYKSLDLEEKYIGKKHIGEATYNDTKRKINLTYDQLSSSSLLETTQYIRPTIFIQHTLPFTQSWLVSTNYLGEKNRRNDVDDINLNSKSISFDQIDFNLNNKSESNLHLNLGYQYRIDRTPEKESFTDAYAANKYSMLINWKQGKQSNLALDMSYRKLEVLEPDQVDQETGSNLLARADYNWSLLNNGIKSNTSYSVGSGQELKREYEYVEVERGEGNFVWIDSSPADGIQQQVEFIQDIQSDTANFIIVTIFNNEFIRTNTNSLNQNFRVDFKKIITKKDPKFILKSLSKISFTSNFKLEQKTLKLGDNQIKDFFKFDIADTNVVRYNGALNNTFFINRASPVWDLQLGNRSLSNRFTQVTGIETRNVKEYYSRLRLSLVKRFDFIMNTALLQTTNESEQYIERNFEIKEYKIAPELNIRPNNSLRFVLKYELISKKQQVRELENLSSNDITIETTYRKIKKLNVNTSFSYVNVKFEGLQNTPIAFELLNGLKSGKNYIWNIGFTKRLANNVDFIASYEGRKTGSSRMIHTARAQVKASF